MYFWVMGDIPLLHKAEAWPLASQRGHSIVTESTIPEGGNAVEEKTIPKAGDPFPMLCSDRVPLVAVEVEEVEPGLMAEVIEAVYREAERRCCCQLSIFDYIENPQQPEEKFRPWPAMEFALAGALLDRVADELHEENFTPQVLTVLEDPQTLEKVAPDLYDRANEDAEAARLQAVEDLRECMEIYSSSGN